MLFPTLDYLLFLPLTVALFWAVRQGKLWVLAGASLLFYASWSVSYLGVLVLVTATAWWASNNQQHLGKAGWRLILLALFVPLIAFKYWDWMAWNIEELMSMLGLDWQVPTVNLGLPVGISFFTFQAAAYVIDCRRQQTTPAKPLPLFAFLAFFPQLVAGPIVRVGELMPQLTAEKPTLQRGHVGEGMFRITKGMLKKLLIADLLKASMVDPVFAAPQTHSSLEVLVSLYAYTLQIYYDFSAYTDIAIGSALLFGIRLPENFRRPYKALSVAEFWRRWHLTLSNWVRDYIYYPLGGSRMSSDWAVYRNIIITMVIIGIWHGASWNFVIYGVLHGTAVSVNRWRRKQTGRHTFGAVDSRWGVLWRFLLTFHFVVLARILFRTADVHAAGVICQRLLDWSWLMPRFSPTIWLVFLIGYAIHFAPDHWVNTLQARFVSLSAPMQAVVAALVAAACWHMGTGDQLAFIYYQF